METIPSGPGGWWSICFKQRVGDFVIFYLYTVFSFSKSERRRAIFKVLKYNVTPHFSVLCVVI